MQGAHAKSATNLNKIRGPISSKNTRKKGGKSDNPLPLTVTPLFSRLSTRSRAREHDFLFKYGARFAAENERGAAEEN